MEMPDALKQVGLNEKQVSVYLALLELGTADVSSIAKKAGIKRPTCYLVLDDLKKQGLVLHVPAKVNLFTAEDPEKIVGDLYKKQEVIKRFLPQLQALHNAKKEKPAVQLFEGREGIRQVYEKIYMSESVSFFGTVKEALIYDPEGLNAFVDRAANKNFKIRDLLTLSKEDIEYAKKARIGKNYEIRFVKAENSFLTDNAIFENNVVFFSFNPQIFAVVITSREISHAIKTLFEYAWAYAETYDKVMNDSNKKALV